MKLIAGQTQQNSSLSTVDMFFRKINILFVVVTVAFACEGETITRSVFIDHPLDEVPIGCQAIRVDEERWSINCDLDGGAIETETIDMGSVITEFTDMVLEDMEPADMLLEDMAPADMAPADMASTDMAFTDMAFTDMIFADMALVDMGLAQDCLEPLSLSSPSSATLPLQLLTLEASGGSGEWHFELIENNSGALLNSQTGAYLSGSIEGVIDVIRVSDRKCPGAIDLEIKIVNPLEVAPRTPEVERGDRITIEVAEGSGDYEISVLNSESGGQMLGDTLYAVGSQLGLDVLEVRDLQTNERVAIAMQVRLNADIEVSQNLLIFPTGASIELSPRGGSGYYDLEAVDPLQVNGLIVSANEATDQMITIKDHFTPKEVRIRIQAVQSLNADVPKQNDHFVNSVMWAENDIDGDGTHDLIIGRAQADVGALNGGGIFIFLSGDAEPEQLYPSEPSQVFFGEGRRDELGHDFKVIDLNHDQYLDLIYGVKGADVGLLNNGALYVHYGVESGGFEIEPSVVLSSNQNDDGLGAGIAVCDFNGDGWQDIAGGAFTYENRRDDPISWNEGGVFIYLGGENGFSASPYQIVVGKVYQDQAWLGVINHQLGYRLSAGDYNGDGYCDLVSSSISWVMGGQGVVYIHAGHPADEWGIGGVSPRPKIVMTSNQEQDQSGQLGRRLVSADFNGDGIDDLAVAHHNSDYNLTNQGAVHVYYGGGVISWDEHSEVNDEDTPILLSPYQSDWSYFGRIHDQFGTFMSAIDYDGQEPADLLVTSMYGDGVNGWDTGILRVFLGHEEGLDSEPITTLHGASSAFQLFESAACLGDINGDGEADWVAQSNRQGSEFWHYGAQYLITSEILSEEEAAERNDAVTEVHMALQPTEADPELTELVEVHQIYNTSKLTLPTQASGAQFGYGVAWVGDFNADGFEDAVVTASHSSYRGNDGENGEINSGGIWVYYGEGNGLAPQGVRVDRFSGFSSWDHIRDVSSLGDFNGDGYPDFAVAIGNDERPSDWGDSHWLPQEDCVALHYDQGGTYIFLGGPSTDLVPDFVYYGDTGGLIPEKLTGGFDYNGDGYGDFAIGMIRRDREWGNDIGGADIVFGRPIASELVNWPGPLTPLQVICQADEQYFGENNNDHFAWSITGVDDLNSDGCDELAIGSRLHDGEELRDQGAVFVVFGHNLSGCLSQAEGLVIQSGDNYSQFGASVAAGDIDGDRLDDIAVGAPYSLYDGQRWGGVWLIPGTMIANAPRVTVDHLFGMNGAENQQDQVRLWFDEAETEQWFAPGTQDRSEAGWGVGIVERPWPQTGAVVVPSMRGSHMGKNDVAIVKIYEPDANGGLNLEPSAVMYGETQRPFSRLGEAIDASLYSPRILLGAKEGGGIGLDHGSAYVIDLSILWDR